MRRAISNIETRLPMEIVTRWSNFVRDEFRRRAQNHLIGHTHKFRLEGDRFKMWSKRYLWLATIISVTWSVWSEP